MRQLFSLVFICFSVIITFQFCGCTVQKENDSYTIVQESVIFQNADGKEYSVFFPQITGLSDDAKQSQLNTVLKSEITGWINENCFWAEEYYLHSIYKTESILSLLYTKDFAGKNTDAIHPCSNIGITIDINSGNRLELSDIMDMEELTDYLLSYSYENEFSAQFTSNEIENIITWASMSPADYLNMFDINYIDASYLCEKPTFYLIDDGIVLVCNEYSSMNILLPYSGAKTT